MDDAGPSPGDVTEDTLLAGRVRLLQPRRGHRAGTDAVLLAGLADARPGDRVVDLGSASGAVGLMVAARVAGTQIALLERGEDLVALARDNIARNGLDSRARAVLFDAFEPAGYPMGEADLVVTNPPWFDATLRPSPDPGRRAAHVMVDGGLPLWCRTAAALLKPRGRLCMIHRADALGDVLAAFGPAFGSVVVLPVYPIADRPATRIVVEAVKAGRAALRIAPPLVLHEAGGAFTPHANRLHRGDGDPTHRSAPCG